MYIRPPRARTDCVTTVSTHKRSSLFPSGPFRQAPHLVRIKIVYIYILCRYNPSFVSACLSPRAERRWSRGLSLPRARNRLTHERDACAPRRWWKLPDCPKRGRFSSPAT